MKGLRRAKPRTFRRLLDLAAGGAGLFTLSYGAYVAQAWWRFGRGGGADPRDPVLDRFLPYWEVRERHEVEVKAPLERTYAVARGMDLERSWLVRAVFRGREWLFRQPRDARATPGPRTCSTAPWRN